MWSVIRDISTSHLPLETAMLNSYMANADNGTAPVSQGICMILVQSRCPELIATHEQCKLQNTTVNVM